MKKIIICVFLNILFSISAFAQTNFGKTNSKKLEIHHLVGDFYVYTTYKKFGGTLFPSNSMYVVTDDGVIMIDTPWDESQFQPILDSIEARHHKKVVLCIATHYHDDRTAGLKFLKDKDIRTYTSKQTFDLCKKENGNEPEFYFEKDTTFTIGNKSFKTFYPGEGHTRDNIVIWFAKEKILFGGCLVKSSENHDLGNIADANLKAWPISIENTIKTFPKPKFIIPGHFRWDKKALKHTLKLLRQNGY